MSTLVSALVEEVQDRIPEEKLPGLFPALNRAIAVISSRLFLNESDLIIGELSVPVYASVAYTAATIAFADGGIDAVDTIADSANGFVTAGFEANMPVGTSFTTNLGPYRITAVAAGTLTLHAEESIAAQAAGSSYTLTSVDEFGYLPDDFNGLIEKPYTEDETWELQPLPSQREKLIFTSAGVPKYYKLKGNRLYLTPGTSSDITIKGDYWQKPTRITKMNQYVPFHSVMDSVIQEYLIRTMQASPAADADLQNYLYREVDLISPKRDKQAPVGMPTGLSWGF